MVMPIHHSSRLFSSRIINSALHFLALLVFSIQTCMAISNSRINSSTSKFTLMEQPAEITGSNNRPLLKINNNFTSNSNHRCFSQTMHQYKRLRISSQESHFHQEGLRTLICQHQIKILKKILNDL